MIIKSWKWRYRLFNELPKVCPYCNGEVIERGFEGVNWRVECRSCERVLIE